MDVADRGSEAVAQAVQAVAKMGDFSRIRRRRCTRFARGSFVAAIGCLEKPFNLADFYSHGLKGKCGGRKTYAEDRPEVVALAKQMAAQRVSTSGVRKFTSYQ